MSGLVEYPCPLGEGRFAVLRLPSDLTKEDVRRIVAHLRSMAPDWSTLPSVSCSCGAHWEGRYAVDNPVIDVHRQRASCHVIETPGPSDV